MWRFNSSIERCQVAKILLKKKLKDRKQEIQFLKLENLALKYKPVELNSSSK